MSSDDFLRANEIDRRRFLKVMAGGVAGTAVTGQTGSWARLGDEGMAALAALAQESELERVFREPPEDAGLWVVWHWMNANVTREGITADLEAMAAAGIRGAAMFSVGERNPNTTVVDPPADPLSPHWWGLVRHCIAECRRLGLTMAMQICDGWATAGGPWITPEMSQQHVIWSEREIDGGRRFTGAVPRPVNPAVPEVNAQTAAAQPAWMAAAREYYRDVALLAFPVPAGWGETSRTRRPSVTATLPVSDLARIADPANTQTVVDTDQGGYLQFAFEQPFTLRSVTIRHGVAAPAPGGGFAPPGAFNIPAHSMEVQVSDDGEMFRGVGRLQPMLGGWQTRVADLTHSVPEATGRFFRLVHAPGPVLPFDEQAHIGTRPPDNNRLRLSHVVLSSTPVVHHLPGKSAETWGKSRWMTAADAPEAVCVPFDRIVDLTDRMRPDGTLDWQAPAGRWRLLRIGYASTGRTNSPAGSGQGLECDKFNPEAARVQFNGWFGEALRQAGPEARAALRVLNIDSWEGGSQNWSPVFADEFRRRRGYDPVRYLPAMTGVPVQNADVTERFLLDVRQTIAELVHDNFFVPTVRMAHENGCIVSAETTNPVFPGDGMLHYEAVDVPTGEFWVTAQQNYKPLDVKEAVSSSRLYGKKIAMTESFTGGGDWLEHPGNLKALGDHNFAQGINKFMLHLWGHQPFPGRVPGIPGSAGTYFNAHQTWWKPGRAWFEYLRRAQALLQLGTPVVDVLYYTGEDVPRRALLEPEFGTNFVIDPDVPEGYYFDSVNRDALLRLARAENGRLVFPSGSSYRVLVLRPETIMTPEVARKVHELVSAGVTVVGPRPSRSASLRDYPNADAELQRITGEIWGAADGVRVLENRLGAGRVYWGRSLRDVLAALGVAPDVAVAPLANAATGEPYEVTLPARYDRTLIGEERVGGGIQWTHRQGPGWDLYFLSNQEPVAVSTEITFRVAGRVPELWHPDAGRMQEAPMWREEEGRITLPMTFDPAGSLFVVFRRAAAGADPVVEIAQGAPAGVTLARTDAGVEAWASRAGDWTLRTRSGRTLPVRVRSVPAPIAIEGPWSVTFLRPAPIRDVPPKEVRLEALESWSVREDPDVRFYSGTATYRKELTVPRDRLGADRRTLLDLGRVADLAEVRLNGRDLGVLWKAPFLLDVTGALVAGTNRLEIDVTNTWRNRLIGDAGKPAEQRVTWLQGQGPPANAPLLPAGLLGPVRLFTEVRVRVG